LKPEDFIIGIDMDDTLENLNESWTNWLNKKYNLSVNPEEICDWEMKKFFPTLTDEQLYGPLYDPEFWETVRPKDGAQEYLKKLINMGFTVYIVTCSHYNSLQPKVINCLLKYFPYIDWRQIISIRNKQLLRLDVLVDDYHKNLIHASYKGILMDMPYNRSFQEDNKNIKRAYNWNEAFKYILRLSLNMGFNGVYED